MSQCTISGWTAAAGVMHAEGILSGTQKFLHDHT